MSETKLQTRARYETQLAHAHRNLYFAMARAEDMGDAHAAEDVASLLLEVTRLAQASLSGHPLRHREASDPLVRNRKPMKGQLRLKD
jgi:hypothetical protein